MQEPGPFGGQEVSTASTLSGVAETVAFLALRVAEVLGQLDARLGCGGLDCWRCRLGSRDAVEQLSFPGGKLVDVGVLEEAVRVVPVWGVVEHVVDVPQGVVADRRVRVVEHVVRVEVEERKRVVELRHVVHRVRVDELTHVLGGPLVGLPERGVAGFDEVHRVPVTPVVSPLDAVVAAAHGGAGAPSETRGADLLVLQGARHGTPFVVGAGLLIL